MSETVITPAGKRPISQVHHLPKGGRVAHDGNEVHLIDANGNIILKVVPGESKPRDPEESGWITYAYWTHDGSPPIQAFQSTFTVPPDPITDNGQTIFLFIDIEPAGGHAILQPVLQWGPSAAGGGSYWSVASWYLVGHELAVFSSLTEVSVGDSLESLISLTGFSDSSFNYKSSFAGISDSSLGVTGSPELVYATETLEAYGVTQSSDYPSGSTSFTNINLYLTDSTFPSLSWSVVDDVDDGLTTTVEVDGSQDGEVTVHYPES